MDVVRDPQVFLDAPDGRCFVGRRHLVFCPSAELMGFAAWGDPDEHDVLEIMTLITVGLRPSAPRRSWIVDLRGIESISPLAFGQAIRHMQQYRGRMREVVEKQAQLRPPGLTGAIVAGFAQVARLPFPERVFLDAEEALAWLPIDHAVGRAVLDEIDALRNASLAVHPVVAGLRRAFATTGPMTLAQAARRLAVSARSLQRALHESGTSYRGELRAFQMSRAKELLCENRATLSFIAAEVGFSSFQHFATAFRRATGEPPGAFRARQGAASSK